MQTNKKKADNAIKFTIQETFDKIEVIKVLKKSFNPEIS